jgi:hypothetical protein
VSQRIAIQRCSKLSALLKKLLINFYRPTRENLPLSLENQFVVPDLLKKGVQGSGGDVGEAVVLQEAVLKLPFSNSLLICLQSGTVH